jgi:plasmid stabilization system protein ParE
MAFKVVFRETFLNDLEHIVRSIAVHNPTAAYKLGLNIIRLSENLASFPERYPRVRQRPRVRRFITQKYFKVFYLIRNDLKVVEILRVWDGRRGTFPTLS